jgi:hypothetical protein
MRLFLFGKHYRKMPILIWRLMDNKEYDELMSRKLWYEVTRDEELLEFDF